MVKNHLCWLGLGADPRASDVPWRQMRFTWRSQNLTTIRPSKLGFFQDCPIGFQNGSLILSRSKIPTKSSEPEGFPSAFVELTTPWFAQGSTVAAYGSPWPQKGETSKGDLWVTSSKTYAHCRGKLIPGVIFIVCGLYLGELASTTWGIGSGAISVVQPLLLARADLEQEVQMVMPHG